VDLSTGRREVAGLGMPDGRGIPEGCSMVMRNALGRPAASMASNAFRPVSERQLHVDLNHETRNTDPPFSTK
jgi:hypothetical protein